MGDGESAVVKAVRKTALYERHRALGAKMTDFHGWEMPLYYTGILEEHEAVRRSAGLFDVSHMGQALVSGPEATVTLNEVTVSDISQVAEGRACYTLMLNEAGGIVDDLILYRLGEAEYLLILNCGNRTSDLEWLSAHRQGRTQVTDISEGRSILALQGPLAARSLERLLDAKVMGLGRFEVAPIRTMGPAACLARTGYTGADGFELFLPDQHAKRVWDALAGAPSTLPRLPRSGGSGSLGIAHLVPSAALGARQDSAPHAPLCEAERAGLQGRPDEILPAGLGARDTLRLEAGLRLWGSDMDTTTSPYEAGLEWTVAIAKPSFIGKSALVRQREEGVSRKLVGFELSLGPVPRSGMELIADRQRPVGTVTSGTFSPLLKKPIGMGYVERGSAQPGVELALRVRNQWYPVRVVKLPFWKPAPVVRDARAT